MRLIHDGSLATIRAYIVSDIVSYYYYYSYSEIGEQYKNGDEYELAMINFDYSDYYENENEEDADCDDEYYSVNEHYEQQ